MKIIKFIKAFIDSFTFSIRYSLHVAKRYGEIESFPACHLMVTVLKKPYAKSEYFIFDKSTPLNSLICTTSERLATSKYHEYMDVLKLRKEDMIFIKVTNLGIEK